METHLAAAGLAKERGADVIAFPELGLTGYLLKDLTYEVACRLTDPPIERLLQASAEIDILFSFIEEGPDHRFYVAAVYAADGRIAHVHRKLYLPTYGLFEEGRHVARGGELDSFAMKGGARAGMMICEDAWHVSVPYLLALSGADILFIPAAGPGRALGGDPNSGAQAFWERMLRTYAQLFSCYIIFVNRVGFEDGLFFFGHSFAVAPDGEIVSRTETHERALCMVDIDLEAVRRERYRTPLLRDEDVHLTLRTLSRLAERR